MKNIIVNTRPAVKTLRDIRRTEAEESLYQFYLEIVSQISKMRFLFDGAEENELTPREQAIWAILNDDD